MDKTKLINFALTAKALNNNKKNDAAIKTVDDKHDTLANQIIAKIDNFSEQYVHHQQFAKSIEMLRHDCQELVAALYEIEIKDPIKTIIQDQVNKIPKPKDGKDGKSPEINTDAIVEAVYERVISNLQTTEKAQKKTKDLYRLELYNFMIENVAGANV
jgi:hypothetical protein